MTNHTDVSKSAHTPTPWVLSTRTEAIHDQRDPMFWHCDVIRGGIRIARVAGMSKEEAEANAAFIVRAVNAHDEIVSRIEAAVGRIESVRDVVVPGGIVDQAVQILKTALVIAAAEPPTRTKGAA